MNCAIFASGGGTNFQALLDRRESGDLHAAISVVIGNNSKAGAFERARRNNIPTLHLAPSHFSDEQSYINELLETLARYRIDLIVLAGYMKMLPVRMVNEYSNKIVNIHPALLPAFGGRGLYGIRVHEAVIEYGAKISGVTVHFVDEQYDHGPVIYQATVPVLESDDARALADRVLQLEHASYWRVIEAIGQGRIRVDGRRVFGAI